MHCDYTEIMNNSNFDIHDDYNFLPFHRTYLEKLEDFLLEKGYPQYVPLPKWTGLIVPPIEFSTVNGTGNLPGNGVSPICGNAGCTDQIGPCTSPQNWTTHVVNMPNYLKLPVQTGNNNDLCDWDFNPSVFSIHNDQTGLNKLSRKIESPWHSQGHGGFGLSAMTNFRSPTAAIFWLWNAAVDDKWRDGNVIVHNQTPIRLIYI